MTAPDNALDQRTDVATYRPRHWVTAAGVGALLGLLGSGLMIFSQDCEGFGCIGTLLLAAAVGAVFIPLLAVVALWAMRVPAPVRCGLAGTLVSLFLGTAAATLDAAIRGYSPGSQATPAVMLMIAGALSGPAGVVLGGVGFRWRQRVGVAVLVAVAVTLVTLPMSGR